MMTIPCFLGIDAGTQGLTALLVKSSLSSPLVCDENKETSSLKVLAIGEGSYGFAPDLPEGCYEQDPLQWEDALLRALKTIYDSLEDDSEKPMASDIEILSICLTGQMHGCVMIDKDGKSIGTARLWCDARNQEEADELSELFGERMPKRLTAARYLWSLKHEPLKTERCVAITTPAGYLTHKLTSNSNPPSLVLGVGEASGMFPIDDASGCSYRGDWIAAFDGYVRSKFPERSDLQSIGDLLPEVRIAGDTRNSKGSDNEGPMTLNKAALETGGWLSEVRGLFGDEEVLVAPAEGDQPTALAASLIGEHGTISCSFGTSVVANVVGKTSMSNGSSTSKKSLAAVDRFNAVNGQPISMVWLRNGTTYLNSMVDSYGGNFKTYMKEAMDAPRDCDGLLALPFLDDEPGQNVNRGGTGMIVGFGHNHNSHKAGNVIKAAIVSVMFNLYLGTQQVEEAEAAAMTEGDSNDNESLTKKREIVFTGGLTKTPETGQILADIFDRPVRLMEAADEGGAWGAALLAKYFHDCYKNQSLSTSPHPGDWPAFLTTIDAKEQKHFYPQPEAVRVYRSMLEKYKKLLELQPQLDQVMNGPQRK